MGEDKMIAIRGAILGISFKSLSAFFTSSLDGGSFDLSNLFAR
jgi:hypothetical protein